MVLVSSGAIGVGMGQMGLDARPEKIPEQQALASMGQCELMTIYQQRFTTYGQKISQVLLTHDVLDYPESRQNVFNTLDTLLEWGIIPIINENDTIAVDELDHHTKFGDNDQLSAIVADIVGAACFTRCICSPCSGIKYFGFIMLIMSFNSSWQA